MCQSRRFTDITLATVIGRPPAQIENAINYFEKLIMGILVPVRSRPIQEGFSDSTTNLRIPLLMRGKSLYPWVRYKSQSEKQRNAQGSGGCPKRGKVVRRTRNVVGTSEEQGNDRK
jgi:hypothetical protein